MRQICLLTSLAGWSRATFLDLRSVGNLDAQGAPIVTGEVKSVSWSNTSTLVVTGHSSGKLAVWKTDGSLQASVCAHASEDPNCVDGLYAVNSVAWFGDNNPNGRIAVGTSKVASSGAEGAVKVFTFTGPSLLPSQTSSVTTSSAVLSVAWQRADGLKLVIGMQDGTIQLFEFTGPGSDATDGLNLGESALHSDQDPKAVNSVAWSPDGACPGRKSCIVSGGADSKIKAWDPDAFGSGSTLVTGTSPSGSPVSSVAWSSWVASSDATYVRVWENEMVQQTWNDANWSQQLPSVVSSVSWQPGGSHLVAGTAEGRLFLRAAG